MPSLRSVPRPCSASILVDFYREGKRINQLQPSLALVNDGDWLVAGIGPSIRGSRVPPLALGPTPEGVLLGTLKGEALKKAAGEAARALPRARIVVADCTPMIGPRAVGIRRAFLPAWWEIA